MSRPVVLIVEDDADLSDALDELLSSHGFGVVVAHSTPSALERASHAVFDIIVSDLLVDSPHVPDAWRQIERLREFAPVGVLSGIRISSVEAMARELRFALQKPVSSETFLSAVTGALPTRALDSQDAWSIRTYFACIERQEWNRLEELLADDVRYHVPGSDPIFSRVVLGRAGFIGLARETFSAFVDPRFAIESIRPLPDGHIVEYTASWGPMGERSSMPGAVVMKLDGRFVKEVGVRLNLPMLRDVLVGKQA